MTEKAYQHLPRPGDSALPWDVDSGDEKLIRRALKRMGRWEKANLQVARREGSTLAVLGLEPLTGYSAHPHRFAWADVDLDSGEVDVRYNRRMVQTGAFSGLMPYFLDGVWFHGVPRGNQWSARYFDREKANRVHEETVRSMLIANNRDREAAIEPIVVYGLSVTELAIDRERPVHRVPLDRPDEFLRGRDLDDLRLQAARAGADAVAAPQIGSLIGTPVKIRYG